jgi:phage shock protein PspC (stress-responsive transcriptional regulator)
MKKVININLGGLPYIIDEDAFEHLSKYLGSIRKHFSYSEGCDEILSDIELRMSELFQEQLKAKQIITLQELNNAIEILGTPEDFGAQQDGFVMDDEPHRDKDHSKFEENGSYKYIKTGKKIFRDMDEKIIGGVCSGIAAYLGVSDPIWIRIVFAAGIPLGFWGPPLYIILMMIMPKAKTAADRLAMRGEPINVDNIARTIENQINDISDTLSELGSKKKVDPKEEEKHFRVTEEISHGFTVAGGYVTDALGFLAKMIKPIFSLGFIGLLILFAVLASLMLFSTVKIAPLATILLPISGFKSSLGIGSLMAVVLIPIILAIILISRWFFPQAAKGSFKYFGFTWIIALGTLVFIGLEVASTLSSASRKVTNTVFDKNSLNISLKKGSFEDNELAIMGENNFNLGDIEAATEAGYVKVNVLRKINIVEGEEKYISFNVETFARGSSQKNASVNAKELEKLFVINGNSLEVQSFLKIDKNSPYRGQNLSITVEVPKGKMVTFNEESWKLFNVNSPAKTDKKSGVIYAYY